MFLTPLQSREINAPLVFTEIFRYNIDKMRRYVLNGPEIHPGANMIRTDNYPISLQVTKGLPAYLITSAAYICLCVYATVCSCHVFMPPCVQPYIVAFFHFQLFSMSLCIFDILVCINFPLFSSSINSINSNC